LSLRGGWAKLSRRLHPLCLRREGKVVTLTNGPGRYITCTALHMSLYTNCCTFAVVGFQQLMALAAAMMQPRIPPSGAFGSANSPSTRYVRTSVDEKTQSHCGSHECIFAGASFKAFFYSQSLSDASSLTRKAEYYSIFYRVSHVVPFSHNSSFIARHRHSSASHVCVPPSASPPAKAPRP
jgi:hypothetical protein